MGLHRYNALVYNLFGSNTHVIADVTEDGWFDEIAFSIWFTTSKHHLCSFFLPGFDQLHDLRALLLVDLLRKKKNV